MPGFNPYLQYRDVKYNTADQGVLIMTSFDGAIRFCRLAKECLERGEAAERGKWLVKAFDVVTELRKSVKPTGNGEIARHLDEAYTYIGRQLTLANVMNRLENLNNALMLLESMRDAWREVVHKERAAAAI
ncbi:MAG: flagellar export chaperone FliS [Calditrichota bacterium]